MSLHLKYMESPSLDRERWNRAVEAGPRPLAYGYTDYLDAVSTHWGAVVAGEYDWVMPLPWNAKFLLFRQLYMPPYIQQLGPFGPSAGPFDWNAVLRILPKEIRYMQLSMSHAPGTEGMTRRNNYIIELNNPHEQLFKQYSSNHRRNVRRSREEQFTLGSIHIEQFLPFADHHYLPKLPEPDRYRTAYHRLIPALQGSGRSSLLGVKDAEDKLLAAAFLPRAAGRLTLLIPVTSFEGRDRGAMFYLLDELIRLHADSGMTLDFEGSTIPSIARFYKGFGAQNEPYFSYRHNRLPFGLKQFVHWIKER